MTDEQAVEIPAPYHRWAINEDPDAPSVHVTSTGRPDHCLACGVVRYPLADALDVPISTVLDVSEVL
jgi:hypothetical protein